MTHLATAALLALTLTTSMEAFDVDAGLPDAGMSTDVSRGDAGADDFAPDGGVSSEAAPLTIDAGAQATPDAGITSAEPPKLSALPKGFTGIAGTVTDARSGEGLIEATVKVVQGAKKSALTDLNGAYRLKLPPGTYDLRIFYALYEGRRVQSVEVKAGAVTQLDVAL
ncbi:MAG: carboxypeptidase regulatory-like domain-containing protein, partial [Myxococcaceae bacterium]|nr:carboxypeptidase regulatory-like domain-containing protein [Myxococcaceae bacterium]